MLVENRIVVKAGFAEAVLERFAKPKQVHTFEGFVRMDVLHGKSENEGEEEIRVCTTWRSKADFEAWASSDSFRGAHAKRQEQQAEGAAADQAERPAHGHGGHGQPAHGSGHGRPAAAGEGAGPIVGNRVTFYRVAASHLPAAAAAEQG
ncbi:antibiotic biosynthesis monooxygenase [Paenibacillus albicereus]|uniref:antibiotic biosynthesis monooxygenase n=1 Tax=Paenibacillus albicereus TaxID=2726185 RepID=UPI002E2823A6|nr:antibiotic biosynthesis monooxygenase [Paenibacillus albicereus]